MERDFDNWNELKKSLHKNAKIINFRERDIWWYAAGENIGHEINGKNARFSRPILIIRKYGRESFFGVPLSSMRHKENFWFSSIMVKGEYVSALLSQAGSFSVNRLYSKIDQASNKEYKRICSNLKRLLFKEE